MSEYIISFGPLNEVSLTRIHDGEFIEFKQFNNYEEFGEWFANQQYIKIIKIDYKL